MRITSRQDKLRILLIEDSKGDVLLIKKALDIALPAVHTLQPVVRLADAIHILSEQEFDVALLDRSLPDVEGFSGLQTIQNLAPNLPIIYLTAYKDEHTAFEAIEQGAQDYLFKDVLDAHTIKRAIQYAILRKQFEGVLIMRANFDMLTGLANRMLFESRLDMALARMRRQSGHIAVLFLDLDNFKQTNDTLGHSAGDQLLKEVGVRLKTVLRPYDTAARFGGDEFAVLLDTLPKISDAKIVAEKIIQLFTASFLIQNTEIKTTASIGVALCSNAQSYSSETLIKQADQAMYVAKSNGGNRYSLYQTEAFLSGKIASH